MREKKIKPEARLLSNYMPQHPEYLSETGHRPLLSFLAAKAKKAAHFGTHAITNSVLMRKCTLNLGLSFCGRGGAKGWTSGDNQWLKPSAEASWRAPYLGLEKEQTQSNSRSLFDSPSWRHLLAAGRTTSFLWETPSPRFWPHSWGRMDPEPQTIRVSKPCTPSSRIQVIEILPTGHKRSTPGLLFVLSGKQILSPPQPQI